MFNIILVDFQKDQQVNWKIMPNVLKQVKNSVNIKKKDPVEFYVIFAKVI
jgi:hypothetical protein